MIRDDKIEEILQFHENDKAFQQTGVRTFDYDTIPSEGIKVFFLKK